jgi:NADP-dependent 3-hydroxy acid dehydrogenase YdfG
MDQGDVRMDKKIVLVTGASSGIGEAVARRLAAERHTVVLTGRNRKKLESMEREMASGGQRVVAIHGDLTREEDVRFIVAEALKTFGAVQALVHSAGIFRINRVEATSTEEFRQVLDTNLTSIYYLAKQLMPHFYRQGDGHVVAISSVAARQGFSGETAYCASKWGLMGFLEALRLEGGERGVKVTAILPGATLTPAWDVYKGELPKERMISAESVADAVLFALGQPDSTSVRELVVTPARDPFGPAGKE